MVLFRSYCSLGGDAAMPGGLYAGLCHTFLVSSKTGSAVVGRATVNWVEQCEATQFAADATNDSALSSDEMRSREIRSDDKRYKNAPFRQSAAVAFHIRSVTQRRRISYILPPPPLRWWPGLIVLRRSTREVANSTPAFLYTG